MHNIHLYNRFANNGGIMRILLIINSLRNGGAERVAANLSFSLERRGYEVLVITFSKGQIDYPVSNLKELGIESSSNKIRRIFNVFRRLFHLKFVKVRFKPDVSIGFMLGANLYNAITKRNNELTIATIHNTIKYVHTQPFHKIRSYLAYRLSDLVVSVSKGISYEIIEKYHINPKKIRVVYNFVNITKDVQAKKSNDATINLLTIGRLVNQKSQWHLIHAVKLIKTIYPNLILNVLGHGQLFERYQDMIYELKLEKNVLFHGFQKDVDYFYRKSDIFILSSKHEGHPMVLLEAMNLGLPVISTDIPHGPKEILNPKEIDLYGNDESFIEEKYGLLVDYGNNPKSNDFGYRDDYIVNQFVEKIKLLISHEYIYEYYSKQSLKRVQDFSEEKIALQWIGLFEQGKKVK
jgi:glycosyltransferase involved in cell wall biosynthesis